MLLFRAATTTNAGKKGLVPAPSAGQSTRYLSSSGQWSVPAGTTYDKATADTLGLVRIGYTESGQNYPIELDPYGKMYVNVPWEDTTYRAGRALVLEGNAFSVANSGVSSGTYGNTSSVTVEIGESFNVPALQLTNMVGSRKPWCDPLQLLRQQWLVLHRPRLAQVD